MVSISTMSDSFAFKSHMQLRTSEKFSFKTVQSFKHSITSPFYPVHEQSLHTLDTKVAKISRMGMWLLLVATL